MSEKKEFKPLDVGASERVPWKIAKGLAKNIGFKEDGSIEVGKNLEVDGHLQINDQTDGIFLGEPGQENTANIFADIGNGILIIDVKDGVEEYSFGYPLTTDEDSAVLRKKDVKTLFGNQSIVGDGNIDLYRHMITVKTATSGDSTVAIFEYVSSNSLKCNSVQDLRILLNVTAYQFIPINYYGVKDDGTCSESVAGYLTINSTTCQITKNATPLNLVGNITSVSDTVTTI